jgi:hypothetical protein
MKPAKKNKDEAVYNLVYGYTYNEFLDRERNKHHHKGKRNLIDNGKDSDSSCSSDYEDVVKKMSGGLDGSGSPKKNTSRVI